MITSGKLQKIFSDKIPLRDFVETIGHEVTHMLQKLYENKVVKKVQLNNDEQKENYVRFVNCEFNADLGGSLMNGDGYTATRRLFAYLAENSECEKDFVYDGSKLKGCGQETILPMSGKMLIKKAKAEHSNCTEIEQLYYVHPDKLEVRIPGLLEAAEEVEKTEKILEEYASK